MEPTNHTDNECLFTDGDHPVARTGEDLCDHCLMYQFRRQLENVVVPEDIWWDAE